MQKPKPSAAMLASLIVLLSACATNQIGQGLQTQVAQTAPANATTNAQSEPLFELRTYTTHPDKLDALHSRFSNHTQRLFEKHGIKNVAYWTPVDTPNTLVYVIAHRSKTAAEASWKAFIEDPEWRAVYAESRTDGPLVANIESVFMTATDYSPKI